MNEYPLFIPPIPLCYKNPAAWSPTEARAYHEWILSVMQTRTNTLLDYFGETFSSVDPDTLLARLGVKVIEEAFRSQPFVAENGGQRTLSDQGYALAADMGLLVSRLLFADVTTKAHWKLITAKRHVSFNLPVLIGNTKLELDPVSGSVSEAHYLLRTGRNENIWLRMYLFWRAEFQK